MGCQVRIKGYALRAIFGPGFATTAGMSEGPEIHRLAGQLTEELVGSRIVVFETRLKKAQTWLDAHPGAVEGKEIKRIEAAGKNLLWYLEDGIYFRIHLLMWGKIRTYALRYRLEPDPKRRALIITTSRQFVLINGQVFDIGTGDPFEQVPALREIGPDMCSPSFDRRFFLERLLSPDNLAREVGPALLDQRIAAGLGNYLKSDILFECGINPWTLIEDLRPDELDCLAATIPEVGQRAVRNRGQTVSDEVMAAMLADPNYTNPRWSDRHWVFRQTNKPCKVCGTPIKQLRQGPESGRQTFFCPICQDVELESIPPVPMPGEYKRQVNPLELGA